VQRCEGSDEADHFRMRMTDTQRACAPRGECECVGRCPTVAAIGT
jgi:hypothetical protein